MVATTHNHISQMMSNPSVAADGLLLFIALKSFVMLLLHNNAKVLNIIVDIHMNTGYNLTQKAG